MVSFMRKATFFNNFSQSHSSLSEWIEIDVKFLLTNQFLSHSSLSEWIEMCWRLTNSVSTGMSHSSLSEWIEICHQHLPFLNALYVSLFIE